MKITREQFIRGFDAIKESYARRQRINAALNVEQDFTCDIGTDPAIYEFQRLLEEWTGDRADDNGPWPEDCAAEGCISLGLADPQFMSVTDEDGKLMPHLTSAEEIWAMWGATKTGPFLEGGAE